MKKIILCFTLLGLAFTLQAQTYLTENFDSSIPGTWTVTDGGDAAGGTWDSGMVGANSLNGTNAAVVNSDAQGNDPHPQLIETLTSPVFDASSASTLFLSFDQYFNNLNTDFGVVEVFNGTNWVEVLNQSTDVGSFANPDQQNIDITAHKNANMQVRFIYNDDDVWAWYWIVDNIHVYDVACATPSGISVVNITTDSATINWNAAGTETTWEVIIQQAGLGIPTTVGTLVTATTYNATGLNVNSNYEVYIRSFCDSDGYSIWLGPYAFITANIPSPISFSTQSISTTGTNRAVVDMNGDNLDDIVSINDNNINIQEQQTDGSFLQKNITTTSADFTPSWSLVAADFDKNGYTDLLYGGGSGVTFMKANANGTAYSEISGSEYVFSQRSNFIDINNDGHLDAFVCHDVAPNVYYINDGNGNLQFYQTPEDGTTNGAPHNLGGYASGGNYGSIWVDYDNDGDQDMFIAKCGGITARRTNQMHTNDGNGNYTENAAAIGLADPMQTWSSAWGDFDNDGDMDVFVGSSDPNDPHKLMRNDMNTIGTFTNVSVGSGSVNATTFNHENVAYDFDNDGFLDIASNGDILFGNGDLTFAVFDDLVPDDGSFGDLNNDGFIDAFGGDIVMNNTNSNNWIVINTNGTSSNIDGIGARVELTTALGTQIRDVRSGDGFRYMNTLNTHFGIGTETTITAVTITWSSGIVDQILYPIINETLSVTEGEHPLSVDNFLVENLILYPNPTKQDLNLNGDYEVNNHKFQVFDISGRQIFKGTIKNNKIDVSRLQSGNYILRIANNEKVRTQKFIKQ
ncbi:FG-GAP-like repeat-containing protein [Lacinutrix sp. Bg11-31]|uniref:FG-GAP-like repeat-containing protein n=1 Tax=Lacinutrix sp. Bg11-31 TaxID=2057808 RepID=UPI0012FE1A3A|nr:FG-GAP-like repeat-containing protein [Lacinutrix sp. Bg11-31]